MWKIKVKYDILMKINKRWKIKCKKVEKER